MYSTVPSHLPLHRRGIVTARLGAAFRVGKETSWEKTLNSDPPQIRPKPLPPPPPGRGGPEKPYMWGAAPAPSPRTRPPKAAATPARAVRVAARGGGATRGASAPRVSAQGGPRRSSAARGASAPRVSALGQPARSLTALLPPFNSAGRGFCGFMSKSQSAIGTSALDMSPGPPLRC